MEDEESIRQHLRGDQIVALRSSGTRWNGFGSVASRLSDCSGRISQRPTDEPERGKLKNGR